MKQEYTHKIKIPGFVNAGWIDNGRGGITMVAIDLKKNFYTPFSPRKNGKRFRGKSVYNLKRMYGID